jgi:hypothetical protein
MKKNMTDNTNAASYINLVMNTIIELSFDNTKNNQLEHIIKDHGLLRLKPEPIKHEEIAQKIKEMDEKGDFDADEYQNIALTFQCYEYISDELGVFIDNYDSVSKLLSNDIINDQKKSIFQVRNYISLGSIISKNMLEESVQKICAENETPRDKLAAILSKILICTLPNEEVLTEEGISFKMEHIISEVQIEGDNKFIQFANEMRNSE